MPFNFNVELDWNGDGDFADVHENISSEVKAITIEYGRDNDLQRAQAGRARIIVRDSNANWFYDNRSSDIVANYGGIYPARTIRVATVSQVSGFFTLQSGAQYSTTAAMDKYTTRAAWFIPYALFGSGYMDAGGNKDKRFVARALTVKLSTNASGGGAVGPVTFTVQAMNQSGPDGAIIGGQAVISGTALTMDLTGGAYLTAAFASPAILEATQNYSVVARALSCEPSFSVRWYAFFQAGSKRYGQWQQASAQVDWTSANNAMALTLHGHPVHDIFTGLTDDVAADAAKNAREATIYCNDGTDQLQRAKIMMALQENKYSGGNSGLINLALDRAGWPATKRAISSAEIDLYPLVHADRQAAATFLQDIERSEFGLAYIRNDGYFAWEDRNYRSTWQRCTSSQWTCTENEHRNVRPISPLAGIINTAILRAQPKTKAASLDVIWSLQENAAGSNSPFLGTGATTTYWAKYALSGQAPNIAGEVAALISGTDFTANAARDGSGADKTVQISTAITIFAGSAKVAVQNLSDAVYLTKLQVRGKIYRDDPPLEVVSEDTSSQTAYLERHFEVDLPYYSNAATMQAVADAIVAARKNPKAVYEVELINADDTIWEQILARRISDRITLSNSQYNISGDFFIEKIRHEISEAGKVHRCWWTVMAV